MLDFYEPPLKVHSQAKYEQRKKAIVETGESVELVAETRAEALAHLADILQEIQSAKSSHIILIDPDGELNISQLKDITYSDDISEATQALQPNSLVVFTERTMDKDFWWFYQLLSIKKNQTLYIPENFAFGYKELTEWMLYSDE